MTRPSEIAVIGAGVMGLSAAYALSRTSHRITIYDTKGFPADNASSLAGGMLAPYAEIEHMPPAWLAAGLRGIKCWQEMMPGYVIQNGSLMIAHDEDNHILERFKQHLPQGVGESVSVKTLEQQLAGRFSYALHLIDEAHLDPQKILPLLIEKLKTGGAQFTSDNLREKKGFTHFIDCRGIDAAKDDLNLRGVKGEILIVENQDFSLSRPVRLMHPRYPLYIVPRENNIFMIGATNIESAGDGVSLRSSLELMSALYSLHPSFAEAKVIALKSGIRPAYPDNLPRITFNKDVIRCNGLFRHGFLLAPVMAECVADYIDGKENGFLPLLIGSNNDYHDQRKEKKLHHAA